MQHVAIKAITTPVDQDLGTFKALVSAWSAIESRTSSRGALRKRGRPAGLASDYERGRRIQYRLHGSRGHARVAVESSTKSTGSRSVSRRGRCTADELFGWKSAKPLRIATFEC